jgi:hypothetical protein
MMMCKSRTGLYHLSQTMLPELLDSVLIVALRLL